MSRVVTHRSHVPGQRIRLEPGVCTAISPTETIVAFTERPEWHAQPRLLLFVRGIHAELSNAAPLGSDITVANRTITHTQTEFGAQGRILSIELSIP